MTDWEVFSTVAGGATAALLGLLFVAVSIRAEFIARSVELRNRATQTGVLFLTGLLASLLLVIPEQERWLGLEFLVLAGVTGATVPALDRRADRDTTGSQAGHLLELATPNSACLLLAAVVYYCFWVRGRSPAFPSVTWVTFEIDEQSARARPLPV